MAKTTEELLQENNDLLRSLVGNRRTGNSAGITSAPTLGGTNLLEQSLNTVSSGLGKLASGTATTGDILNVASDVMKKIPIVGNVLGDSFKQLGNGVLEVYDTMKETGKMGVTMGNDLGLFNEAVKKGQLTLPEFNEIIQKSSTQLAGLGSNMDKSAAAYLDILKGVQETDAAQDLKAAGMSAKEFADITQLSLMNRRVTDLKDKQAREEAIQSAVALSTELNLVAQITGKSRKEQENALQAQMQRAEIEAQIRLKGDKYGAAFEQSQAQLGKWGKGVQDVFSAIATGGPKTEEQRNLVAALGNEATSAMQKLNAAMESGDEVRIKAAQQEADAAIARRANSEEFAKQVRNMSGAFGPMSSSFSQLYHEMYSGGKAYATAQAELEKSLGGRKATEEEVLKYQQEQLSLKAKGQVTEGEDKGKTNEGAVVGRTIGYIDNLGKVAGGVVSEGFTKLNKGIGELANKDGSIENLNNKFKDLGSTVGMKSGMLNALTDTQNAVNKGINDVAKQQFGIDKAQKPSTYDPTKDVKETRDSGTFGKTGQMFEPKDFIGKVAAGETVLTQDQLKNLISNNASDSASKAMSQAQEIIKSISQSGSGLQAPAAIDTKTINQERYISETKKMLDDQLNLVKDNNRDKLELEKESATQLSEFTVNQHESTMDGIADVNEQSEKAYSLRRELSETGKENPFYKVSNLITGQLEGVFKSEKEAREYLAKNDPLHAATTELTTTLSTLAPPGGTSSLNTISNDIGDMYDPTKVKEILAESKSSETSIFEDIGNLFGSSNKPAFASGNVTYGTISDEEKEAMHSKQLADMESPEAKAELEAARQEYLSRIHSSGMYSEDTKNKFPKPNEIIPQSEINKSKEIGSVLPKTLQGFDKSLTSELTNFTANLKTNFGQIKQPTKTEISTKDIKKPEKVEKPKEIEDQKQQTTVNTTQSINNITLKDLNDQLIQLNKAMGQLISYSAETADHSAKQVKATKGLSGNRFA